MSATLASIAAGSGRLDLVTGPPGIGKTRLAQEFASMAAAEGVRVVRGICWEGDGAPAFWPWIQVLRDILEAGGPSSTSDGETDIHALLAEALAPFTASGQVKLVPTGDAQQARFELFDRYTTLLRELAVGRPLAVVIDDLHCADTGSTLLLKFLAGRIADAPLAVLVTGREPLPVAVADTSRHPWTRHMVLSGLSRPEARRLLDARTGTPAPPQLVDRLMALTDGNPFFLHELGHVVTVATGANAAASVTLPENLARLTLHQYEGLSPACQELLRAASVIGREFDGDLLARAVGYTHPELLDGLQEAVANGVVTAGAPLQLRFAHALVREAVYDQVQLSERAELHRRIAEILEERRAAHASGSAATIAYHYWLALPVADRHKAGTFALAAGKESHAACAHEEAAAHFTRALEILGPSLTAAETCDVMLLLGAAQSASGEWTLARRTFSAAADLARASNSATRFARAALGFKGMMSGTIPVDHEAVSLLTEARFRLPADEVGLTIAVAAALSNSLFFDEQRPGATRLSREALALATGLRDDRLRAIALEATALTQWHPSHIPQLLLTTAELLDIAMRTNEPALAFHARMLRYWSHLTVGAIESAEADFAAATQIARSTRHPRLRWQIALARSARALAIGRPVDSASWREKAHSLGQRVHDSSPAHHTTMQAFHNACLTGEIEGWDSLADTAVDRFPTATGYRAGAALAHAHLGHPRDALVNIHFFSSRSFRNIPRDHFALHTLTLLAEAVALCNAAPEATVLYDLLATHAAHYVVAGWGTVLDGSVSHYLGLLANTMARPDVAHLHFDDALRAHRAIAAPALIARTQLAYARTLQATDRQRATQLAAEAQALYRALGYSRRANEADPSAAIRIGQPNPHPNNHASPLSAPAGAAANPGASGRYSLSRHCLLRTGDYWTLRYSGTTIRLRHSVGITYISRLLAAPGTSLHVIDLRSDASIGSRPVNADNVKDISDPLVDSTALSQYKRRLRDIDGEIARFEDSHDLGQLERLHQEKESIVCELSRAFGLGGRTRGHSNHVERARISVKNRISSVLNHLRAHHPSAGTHLARSIRTGTYCCYSPESPTEWDCE